MSTEELLDHLLVPRPNGSESLSRVASFIETTLASHTPDVTLQTFTAAPHALQLVLSAGFLLMLGFAAALLARRYALGLVLASLAATLLFVEMEWLRSPLSGLLPASESNVVAVFPGHEGGPTLIFTAHTDARSFLARGIPAVTVLGTSERGLPRRPHSAYDRRDRVSIASLERSVDLLAAVVSRVDREPEMLSGL